MGFGVLPACGIGEKQCGCSCRRRRRRKPGQHPKSDRIRCPSGASSSPCSSFPHIRVSILVRKYRVLRSVVVVSFVQYQFRNLRVRPEPEICPNSPSPIVAPYHHEIPVPGFPHRCQARKPTFALLRVWRTASSLDGVSDMRPSRVRSPKQSIVFFSPSACATVEAPPATERPQILPSGGLMMIQMPNLEPDLDSWSDAIPGPRRLISLFRNEHHHGAFGRIFLHELSKLLLFALGL